MGRVTPVVSQVWFLTLIHALRLDIGQATGQGVITMTCNQATVHFDCLLCDSLICRVNKGATAEYGADESPPPFRPPSNFIH